MTRALILLVFGCVVLAGIAAAAILGRGSIPAALRGPAKEDLDARSSIAVSRGPVSNAEGKRDRLAGAGAMMAPLAPQPPSAPGADPVEPLRQAFAADSPIAGPPTTVLAPAIVQQPKARPKPPVPKTYTLLSDAQITAIKGRLNLTASQESYWPPIEAALRAVARKMHDTRQGNPAAGVPPIDPESAEVQALKSAAMPLLFQLREDQKREVRALARIIGLEQVASAI